MYDKMHKAIAFLLLSPIIIVTVSVILSVFVDEGVIMQAWLSMATSIPFGGPLGELSVNVFVDSFGFGYDMAKYAITPQKVTLVRILQDCCRLLLTALCYEALDSFFQNLLGVWRKKSGLHNILMQMASGMVSIVVCTLLATVVTDYLYRQVALLPNIAQGVISTIVSLILIGGAYGVAALVLGATILRTIVYVGVKMILLNVLKVLASYVGILLLFIFLNEGAYLKVLTTVSGWGVVIVLLIGIDLMMSTIFKR